jgi:hypothetical protein
VAVTASLWSARRLLLTMSSQSASTFANQVVAFVRTALVADALSLVTVLALVAALLADFVPLWLIVVTQVLGVLFDGPGMVARDALVPGGPEDSVPLVRAITLQETLQNTAQCIGPLAAGSLPIINTAYYSRTPEALLGRVNGTSFAMVLTALPFSSLAFGWLISATSPETAIAVVVAADAVMVAAFALLPAMRLIDAPAEADLRQDR